MAPSATHLLVFSYGQLEKDETDPGIREGVCESSVTQGNGQEIGSLQYTKKYFTHCIWHSALLLYNLGDNGGGGTFGEKMPFALPNSSFNMQVKFPAFFPGAT